MHQVKEVQSLIQSQKPQYADRFNRIATRWQRKLAAMEEDGKFSEYVEYSDKIKGYIVQIQKVLNLQSGGAFNLCWLFESNNQTISNNQIVANNSDYDKWLKNIIQNFKKKVFIDIFGNDRYAQQTTIDTDWECGLIYQQKVGLLVKPNGKFKDLNNMKIKKHHH